MKDEYRTDIPFKHACSLSPSDVSREPTTTDATRGGPFIGPRKSMSQDGSDQGHGGYGSEAKEWPSDSGHGGYHNNPHDRGWASWQQGWRASEGGGWGAGYREYQSSRGHCGGYGRGHGCGQGRGGHSLTHRRDHSGDVEMAALEHGPLLHRPTKKQRKTKGEPKGRIFVYVPPSMRPLYLLAPKVTDMAEVFPFVKDYNSDEEDEYDDDDGDESDDSEGGMTKKKSLKKVKGPDPRIADRERIRQEMRDVRPHGPPALNSPLRIEVVIEMIMSGEREDFEEWVSWEHERIRLSLVWGHETETMLTSNDRDLWNQWRHAARPGWCKDEILHAGQWQAMPTPDEPWFVQGTWLWINRLRECEGVVKDSQGH